MPVWAEMSFQEKVIVETKACICWGVTKITVSNFFYLTFSRFVASIENGYIWEDGPNSFQPNAPILRLAKDLDMLDELVLSDPSDPRYIYYDNKLQALPMSVTDIFTSDLLTTAGKAKAVAGAMGFVSPKQKDKEETIKEFVCRHLGEEVFERVVDPFISGVYAGDPDRLSIKAAMRKIHILEESGWTPGLVEGALWSYLFNSTSNSDTAEFQKGLPKIPSGSLGSFKQGMESLLRRIQRYLGPATVKTSHKLLNLERDGKEWISNFATPEGEKSIRSKSVLLAMPAFAVADILSKKSSGSGKDALIPEAELLNKIVYPSVTSVTLAYPNNAFKRELKGFGHLIPRSMQIRTLGSIWASSLFPGRAPDGFSIVRSFIGGALDPLAAQMTSAQVVEQVHSDLKKIILKDYAPAPIVLSVATWDKAIPQYDRGHDEIIDVVDRAVASNAPGLFLGGNFKGGISVGDCIVNGVAAADRIGGYLMRAKQL
jgi:oxygen-dependent protoporphyrinogen oxidase